MRTPGALNGHSFKNPNLNLKPSETCMKQECGKYVSPNWPHNSPLWTEVKSPLWNFLKQECGQDGPQVKQGGHWPCGCTSLWRCHETPDWGSFHWSHFHNTDDRNEIVKSWFMNCVILKVDDDGKIVDAKFKTFGCGSAIASSRLKPIWSKIFFGISLIIMFSIQPCYGVDQGKAVDWCSQDQEQRHCQGSWRLTLSFLINFGFSLITSVLLWDFLN